MGMYDEVILSCPKCNKLNEFQSKWGACKLERYSLNNAPLPIIADIHYDGQQGALLCDHCGIQLKLDVQIKTKLVSAEESVDADTWRDMG